MDLEELAFKNANELTELPKEVLLMIIALLQQDRKCWIEQYTRGHNHLVDIQLKIEKALLYIEDRYDYEQNVLTHTFDRDNIKELYEILKGSDK